MTDSKQSMPRLSPIGWSIDETSDLHAAVFDIATGGSGVLEERRNESSKDRSNTIGDKKLHSPFDGDSRTRRTSSAQLPLRRPKTSDRAHSGSFLSTSAKTLRRAASKDAFRVSHKASQDDPVPQPSSIDSTPLARNNRMMRAPSIFRLRRPFSSRASSYKSDSDYDKMASGSSTSALQPEQSFSLLVTTSTNQSTGRASSEHEYGQEQALSLHTLSLPSPAVNTQTISKEGDEAQSYSNSFDAPLLSSRSSSSGGLRRKREPPPLQAAPPNLPLPPLPLAVVDALDHIEDITNPLVDGKSTVRKTKSQNGLGLLRARSILGGLPSPSAEKVTKTSTGKTIGSVPWGSSSSSRLDMSDSSPELERVSLAPSEESRRFNSSTPSLEEARSALDPDRLEALRRGSGSTGNQAPGSSQDSLSVPTHSSIAAAKSRLDSSGGAGALFGGGSNTANGRSRTQSLLPWRQRSGSSTPLDSPAAAGEKSERSSAEKPVKISTDGFDERNIASFLQHVTASAPRAEVPALLAGSGDGLHKKALQLYMQQFLFTGHPLDVALRKLLMSLCLPKETQQIDRVMEAFARRYNECNENLFTSNDQPYMLAFSLMMLHTDTFNRNAKQKMSKADYVRNTSASGVASEVLEYLYDNLTFTQFIYVEDDDFLRRRKSDADSTSSALRAAFTSSNSSVKDPYQIIASGQMDTLRPSVHIDEDSPFSFTGTLNGFDIESLLRAFVNAPSIEIVTARKAPLPSTAAVIGGYYSTLPSVSKEEESIVTLRVTKVGCVSRKDDMLEDNKKSGSRKWKTCGMILSASQLLFFRDLVWTSALDQRIVQQTKEQPDRKGGVLITPQITYFKPDGVLALSDALAVRDTTYNKYNHVFRLIARHGDIQRQYLIQTANEQEMNDWMHKINFCAAFRSSGLRIRGLDVSPDDPGTPSTPSKLDIGDGISATDCSPVASPNASVDSPQTAIPLVGLLRRKLKARLREFQPVIDKISFKLEESQRNLDERLRFAKHLMIATPFMKSTRDRLESIAVPLAQEVWQLRLEVARHSCRREILLSELEAGNNAARAAAPAAAFDERTGADNNLPSTPRSSQITDSISRSSDAMISNDSRAASFALPAAAAICLGNQTTPKAQTAALPEIGQTVAPVNPATPSSFLNSSSALPSMHFTPLGISYANSKDSELCAVTPETPSPNQQSKANGSGKRSFFKSHESPTGHTTSGHVDHERWDRTKMGRDADKRISLVMNLPEAQQWQTLTSKRIPLSPSTERPPPPSSSSNSARSLQKKSRSQRSSSISSSSQAAERKASATKDLSRLYG